jgi:hypothetical protein
VIDAGKAIRLQTVATIIPLYENYRDYHPPRYVRKTVEKLLSWLPNKYLSGLQSVVLTNANAIGKGKTRRVGGRKYVRRECLAFYHSVKRGEAPWIEIVVDNVLAGIPRILRRLPIMRNMAFADALFHEIGHHLDHTVGAPAQSAEAAADAWQDQLFLPTPTSITGI